MPRHSLSLIALGLSLALPSVAYAQGQTASGTQENATEEKVEQIAILGQRQEYNTSANGLMLAVKETPQSISVVDTQLMTDFSLDSVAEAVSLTTGISIQTIETDRSFLYSRGNAINSIQYDGVPIYVFRSYGDLVSDSVALERIEVVRGATGLLTGPGEPSATINLIRKKAKAESGGYFAAKAGSWRSTRFEGDYTTALNESGTVTGLVAGSYEQGESYIDWAERENYNFYATSSVEISPVTQLNFGVQHTKKSPTASTYGGLALFYTDGTQASDLPRSTSTAAKWNRWDRDNTSWFVNLEHEFDSGWMIKAEYESRNDETDALVFRQDGMIDKATGAGLNGSARHYNAERDLQSLRIYATGAYSLFDREHILIVGANMSKSEQSTNDKFSAWGGIPTENFFNWDGDIAVPELPDQYQYDLNEEHSGFYIATQFKLTDSLTAIVGDRVSQFKAEDIEEAFNVHDVSEHKDIHTPYAGLVFAATDDVSLYASVTEIFTPQDEKGINEKLIGPIDGVNREFGIKSTWLDDTLLFNASYFHIKKSNVAERLWDAEAGDFVYLADGWTIAHQGIDGTEHKGYEFELASYVFDNVFMSFNYAHTDSEQNDGTPYATQLPKNQANFIIDYQFDQALSLGASVSWQSKIFQDGVGPNGERAQQDSYTLVNLNASYQINQHMGVQLNVNNLFDQDYFANIEYQRHWGAPRQYEVAFRYAF